MANETDKHEPDLHVVLSAQERRQLRDLLERRDMELFELQKDTVVGSNAHEGYVCARLNVLNMLKRL